MHDCRRTQAQLTDLVFDELPPVEATRLRAEIETCAACHAEYRALTVTLRAVTRAETAVQPTEDFWPGYHARLSQRLQSLANAPQTISRPTTASARLTSAAWWRRMFTASLRVPAPVAAAVAVALVITSALASRPASTNIVLDAPPQVESSAPVRVVEVPVVQEKIVTRTIYVARSDKAQARRATHTGRAAAEQLADGTQGRVFTPVAPPLTLTGFQPAGEVKLRVIKGSFTHEQ